MAQAALAATRFCLAKDDQVYNNYPLMLAEVKSCITKTVAQQMDIFGSSGKAHP